ncbi:DMT family transporter [Sphingomonas oligoaromativorans]|uniref:DMT family transporter n=1 Tax=Sphingomonas oligoaromativorans TaxID=575322 RepID=UPI001FBB41E5|nr:DMT family transporter [Sphingomonas oligoaromativorans]NIJ33413.1 drug/metabolite transporter (DMT)-like permease [Sphingomonas oligoaromativorans]
MPATIAASIFQVGRNALQRSVMTSAGPWGATLVRFLFGLPFSLLFAAVAFMLVPDARPVFGGAFWLSATAGAASQVLATAALLVAMHRSGFAVGTALQQSSLPLAAMVGLVVYHDRLSGVAWLGVGITSIGLAILTWPPKLTRTPHAFSGAVFGLLSGLFFGFSLNAFRHSALAMEAGHPVFAAIVSVCIVQAMQAATLTLILLVRDPAALRAVLRDWRSSLGAGLCGACASSGWFVALALSPAAPVRALGVIEAPIAAFAGHRLFRETLHLKQMLAGLAVIGGIVMTSLW